MLTEFRASDRHRECAGTGHRRLPGPAVGLAIALLLLRAITLCAQSVVLDNFTSVRQTFDNYQPLWQVTGGLSQCYNQTLNRVAGNLANDFIQGCTGGACQPGTPNNSCMYFFMMPTGQFDTFVWPSTYVAGYITSGTWNASINRLNYSVTCDTAWAADNTTGEFGDYINPHDNVNTNTQGQHYYSFVPLNIRAFEPVFVQINATPNHRVGAGEVNWPNDPEWVLPTNINSSGNLSPVHYFDGMTHFYIFPWYTSAATTTRNCWVGPITLSTNTAGESDEYVHDVTAQYTGTQYEVQWSGPTNQLVSNNYDLHYSTQSMHTNGFSTGTNAGPISIAPSDSYPGYVVWDSSAMPPASTMYVAVRPRPAVVAALNTSPIMLYTTLDPMIPTGEQVTVTGVGGNTAANGTWTITAHPRQFWRNLYTTATLTSWQITSTNGPNNVTVNTSTPHGLQVGAQVAGYSDYGQDAFHGPIATGGIYTVTNVVSSTSFQLTVTDSANGGVTCGITTVSGLPSNGNTCNTYEVTDGATINDCSTGGGSNYVNCRWTAIGGPTAWNSVIPDFWSLPAVALNGSTGNGTYTGGGEFVPTSNTAYFTEISISQPAAGPCDINKDGLVNALDVTLAINAALGVASCQPGNDINGDGLCDVVDIQRVLVAAQGGSCYTGP
jgi:hypothetical protein